MKNTTTQKLAIIIFSSLLLMMGELFAADDSFSLEEMPTEPAKTEKPLLSSIEVGVGYVNQDSFKFGDYLGLEKERLFPIVNLDIIQRGPYDGPSARYWNLSGSNFGLTSREARFEFGNQGNYNVWLAYDQLPKFQTESAKTVFSKIGRTNLILPTVWTAATTPAGMTQLNNNLQKWEVKRERRDHRLGFSKTLFGKWKFNAEFQHEIKEGTKEVGGAFGSTGGNARSMIIPEPIDYITDQLRAALSYTAHKGQFQVDYLLSIFDNDHSSLTWQNPFSRVTTPAPAWAVGTGYPNTGRLTLHPDNQFHQWTFSGGYNFTNHTRLTTHLAFGRMRQDENYLPYTVNSNLTAAIPLPRNSLDGKIETTLLNVKIASKPYPKFDLMAHYHYDDRENRTPQSQYTYISADSENQPAVVSDNTRFNLPISFQLDQWKVEGGYRIFSRTQLKASYIHEEIDRDFQEVSKTRENIYRLELRQHEREVFGGGVHFSLAKRNGTHYDGDVPQNESFLATYLATLAANVRFTNHPLLRKFSVTDREREQGGFFVTYNPHHAWALQLNTDVKSDEYSDERFGLREKYGYHTTLDVAFTPNKHFNSYAFYTYELSKSDQAGRDYRGTTNKATDSVDPTRNWEMRLRERVNTLGIGTELLNFKDKYNLGAEYLYSSSRQKIYPKTGSGITSSTTPIPTLIARLWSLELYGKYKIRPDLQAKLSYLYEKLSGRDFAFDGIAPNSLQYVIATGEKTPQYAVSVFGLSLIYDF